MRIQQLEEHRMLKEVYKDATPEQLNEIAPAILVGYILTGLATAARIGAPALRAFLGRGLKFGATKARQGTKAGIDKTVKVTKDQVAKTGKSMVAKNGWRATLGGAGAMFVWDQGGHFIDWVKDLVPDMPEDWYGALWEIVKKYSLPAGAVMAVLYGGKKLYDYIKDKEEEEEMELPPKQEPKRGLGSVTYTDHLRGGNPPSTGISDER